MPLVIAGATSGSTTIQSTDAVTNTLTLPSSTGTLLSTANPQSGGVIQVVQTVVTTASSVSTSATKADIPNLNVAITPKFATSKIMVLWQIMYSNAGNDGVFGFLQRNGTDIALGTTGGIGTLATVAFLTANSNNYWGFTASGNYLDSPATTSFVTYKFQVNSANTPTIYFNRSARGTDGCFISTITAMEIAA